MAIFVFVPGWSCRLGKGAEWGCSCCSLWLVDSVIIVNTEADSPTIDPRPKDWRFGSAVAVTDSIFAVIVTLGCPVLIGGGGGTRRRFPFKLLPL